MNKLNEKGFAVTGVLYTLLVIFLVLMLGLISVFSNRKNVLNKLKEGIAGSFEKVYPNGTIMYFNPNTGEECHTEYTEIQSATGVNTGCMKWYIFNDNETSNTVDMILDHNTTSEILWNSSGSNLSGPSEVLTGLQSDTSDWDGVEDRTDTYTVDNGTTSYTVDYTGYKARLITVDEIVKITGNFEWSSLDTSARSFYFDSLSGTASATCTLGDISSCKYGWLYDRTTDDCQSYGCYNNGDSSIYGYWTISPVVGYENYAWRVYGQGRISDYTVTQTLYGIRPVITIPKNIVVDSTYYNRSYKYAYTGAVQEFVAPINGKYKIELWGASGGKVLTDYSFGGYTSGNIELEKDQKLYIYVGQTGTNDGAETFNGGGRGGYGNAGATISSNISGDTGGYGYSGGGATDVRLVKNADWSNFDSLKSRIMVAGAGAGSSIQVYSTSGENSAAGGLIGYNGGYYSGHGDLGAYGIGGTQLLGGDVGNNIYGGAGTGENGEFGIGGSSYSYSSGGGAGGGGAGYYGGGAGGSTASNGTGHGAGGGSSFISGHNGCDAIDESSTASNIEHTGESDHYSGYIFEDTVMIDGSGYSWTDEKGTEVIGMPTYDGTSTMTGNDGNGYAKITIIETD